MTRAEHPIPPVYDKESRVLILGSFPSVRSRELGFFYGHPQNRVWKTLAGLFEEEMPRTIEEKKEFLIGHRIALWDVVASCEITGSADSSIGNVVPNEIEDILNVAKIERIFTNGGTAHRLYRRYLQPRTGMDAICLPSTSSANATWTQSRLNEAWKVILK